VTLPASRFAIGRLSFAILLLLSTLNLPLSTWAQANAFTYQGHLNASSSPVNGSFDLTFSVWSAASGPSQVGGTQTNAAVPVSNGLFTVVLDFGAGVFTGPPRWLEIGVRPAGSGAFTTLTPRQPITPAPYAIFAATASNVVGGAVVKTLNGLKDDVTLAAGANVTIAPSGNTLTISSTGGGGETNSLWSRNGTHAYYNAGNVGIGIAAPSQDLHISSLDARLRLEATDTFSYAATEYSSDARTWHTGVGGASTPNVNGKYYVFDGNAGQFRLAIDTSGNVGIGTTTPSSKLEILAQDALKITGHEPLLTLRDSNSGNARSTFQAVAGGMNLFTESYLAGVNPFAYVRLDNSGNLGIGSANPVSKLEIAAQDALGMIGFQPFLTFRDSNAGFARSRIQGVNGDIALTTEAYVASGGANPGAGLLMVKNGSGNVGIGTGTPAHKLHIAGEGASGYAIGIEGNATQNRDKGGWVKAMAKVNADFTIDRQFSAFGGTITAMDDPSTFGTTYLVTFPFQVNDRYISVQPFLNGSVGPVSANIVTCPACGPNTISVAIHDADSGSFVGIANEFFIFVY
jgi:hypothetical protein